MKDHTNNNANPSLPPQWNDCTTCGAGITRKTDPSQQCRNCYEDQVRRELRGSFVQYDEMDKISDWADEGTWGFGDAYCPSTGAWG